MPVTSFLFAAFTAAVLIIYYVLPHRWQNRWLLLASMLFYVTWAWEFSVVLVALTLATYLIAQRMGDADKTARRRWMWLGVALSLAALVVLKYNAVFVQRFEALLWLAFRLPTDFSLLRILLPVGLSYTILETISTLVDVNRKRIQPPDDLLNYALYLAWFPKIVSGPIERARTFLPKLQERRLVDNATLATAVTLILFGLFRKLVLADVLAVIIPAGIFVEPSAFTAGELFWWGIASGFQLYNDFCGYTLLVRGVSLLFGIPLSANFRAPAFTRTYAELWTRWHITLSDWLRDYVYFPSSRWLLKRFKKAGPKLSLLVPPFITWMASAAWHGLTAPFLLWGVLMGLLQVAENIPALFGVTLKPMPQRPWWRQALGTLWVVSSVLMVTLLFYTDIPTALEFYGVLFTPTWALPDARIVLFIAVTLVVEVVVYTQGDTAPTTWKLVPRSSLLAFAVIVLVLVSLTDFETPPFIYQGF